MPDSKPGDEDENRRVDLCEREIVPPASFPRRPNADKDRDLISVSLSRLRRQLVVSCQSRISLLRDEYDDSALRDAVRVFGMLNEVAEEFSRIV